MEKEEIFSFCKDEVNRLINKHKLTVDDETIQDFAYMSYIDCNKYWIDKGKDINEKIIKIFVKRTMFLVVYHLLGLSLICFTFEKNIEYETIIFTI